MEKCLMQRQTKFTHEVSIPGIWKSIFQYKKTEFSNIFLLVEIVFSLSSLHSFVDQDFSILTLILTDRRLKSSHALLEMQMLYKSNDKN